MRVEVKMESPKWRAAAGYKKQGSGVYQAGLFVFGLGKVRFDELGSSYPSDLATAKDIVTPYPYPEECVGVVV